MATESDLRDLLRDPDPEGRGAIDLDAVLSRARRRRRPRMIAAQALGSVALVGALFTAVVVITPPQQAAMMVAEDSGADGDESASVPESADQAGESSVDACGEAASNVPLLGWRLDVSDGGSVSAAEPVITVTLRNDGVLAAEGEVEVTLVSFIREGTVVAHGVATTAGGMETRLEAGEEVTWDVPLTVEPCDPMLPLGPGTYELRAQVHFRHNLDDGGVLEEPIVGSPGRVEMR